MANLRRKLLEGCIDSKTAALLTVSPKVICMTSPSLRHVECLSRESVLAGVAFDIWRAVRWLDSSDSESFVFMLPKTVPGYSNKEFLTNKRFGSLLIMRSLLVVVSVCIYIDMYVYYIASHMMHVVSIRMLLPRLKLIKCHK